MRKEDVIITQREAEYPYSIDPDDMIERFEKCYCAAQEMTLMKQGEDYVKNSVA